MEVNAVSNDDRQENNLSEPDPEPGQRSPRNALQKKEEKKKKRTRNHLSTFNQKYEPQDHKRNLNRKLRYSEALSEEKIIEQLEEHAQRQYNTKQEH